MESKGAETWKNKDGLTVIIEDRFKRPTPAGYSDVQIKAEVAPGMFAEIQIHIPEMLIAKEGWFHPIPEHWKPENLGIPNGIGHKLFEEYRAIPKNGTPEQKERRTELERLMDDLYVLAKERHQSRSLTVRYTSLNLTTALLNPSQLNVLVSAASGQGIGQSVSNTLPSSVNPNTAPSGVTAIGASSSVKNRVPSGNGLAISKNSFLSTTEHSPNGVLRQQKPKYSIEEIDNDQGSINCVR